MIFGEFIREKRIEMNYSLRKFCEANDIDPSDWSRIERGLAPPFRDESIIARIGKFLGLSGKDHELFMISAEVARKRIPEHVTKDAYLMSVLPAFFHGTPEELRKYIDSVLERYPHKEEVR